MNNKILFTSTIMLIIALSACTSLPTNAEIYAKFKEDKNWFEKMKNQLIAESEPDLRVWQTGGADPPTLSPEKTQLYVHEMKDHGVLSVWKSTPPTGRISVGFLVASVGIVNRGHTRYIVFCPADLARTPAVFRGRLLDAAGWVIAGD